MKFVKLLTSAYVNGALRHPHEGVLHVEDAEAERLIENEAAEDVTADFSAKDNRTAPVESISAGAGGVADAGAPANPHQSEVAPQAAEDAKPRRKTSADKE